MIKQIKKHWRRFIIILSCLIILGLLWIWLTRRTIYSPHELTYGLTFSPLVLKDMNLDWQEAYIKMLDELKVKHLRLVAYWPMIEEKEGTYDFSELDWQIKQASQRNVDIILAVGARLPRWPECHYPQWYTQQDKQTQQKKLLDYIQATINRYDANPAIVAWQIENEPFLIGFGKCPRLNVRLLDQEIALARQNTKKPIVVTDSGELGIWIPAARRADIFGTSIYRHIYSQPLKHYMTYPLSPNFFRIKTKLTELVSNAKIIVIEMQAEPWGPQPYFTLSEEEKNKTMNMDKLKKMLEYGRQGGFDTFYLWGVEWWYWEKEINGNNEYWEFMKNLFSQSL